MSALRFFLSLKICTSLDRIYLSQNGGMFGCIPRGDIPKMFNFVSGGMKVLRCKSFSDGGVLCLSYTHVGKDSRGHIRSITDVSFHARPARVSVSTILFHNID